LADDGSKLLDAGFGLTVSLLSHSLLDSVTTGGKGSAGCGRGQMNASLPVAGDKSRAVCLSRYTTPYGHQVIISELLWVWLPGVVLMGLLWWRKRAR
jgi:inner membrane protein